MSVSDQHKGLSSSIEKLMEKMQANEAMAAKVQYQLDHFSNGLEEILELVRGGSGVHSLETRLVLLEKEIVKLQSIDAANKDMLALKRELTDSLNEHKKNTVKDDREIMIEKIKWAAIVSPGFIALAMKVLELLGK